MKLAFVGPQAVGKDTASEYVKQKYNLTHISTGDLVREYVNKNNLGTLERENLRMIANDLRAENGGDVLVRMSLDKVNDDVILSGLRAIDEVETFKRLGGKIISITASANKRYEMGKIRGRVGDIITLDQFMESEKKEKANIDRKVQNVDVVISMADFEISNEGTLEELYVKCDQTIKALR